MSGHLIPVRDSETGEVYHLDLQNNTRTMRDQSGRLVTMDLGVADVHIDAALSNVCFGFKLATGIADDISPVVPVAKASDKYYTWDKDDALQPAQHLAVAAGGTVAEISPRLSNAAFSTVNFALQAFVPTEVEANADGPLKPRMAATKRLMNAMMLGREQRVATMYRTAASYASAYKATIAAAAKWNGGASSNPVQDLYTRIEAALMPITDVVMSERTWHDFVQNAAVQKYTASKQVVPGANPIANAQQAEALSALLGLPPIRIGAMKAKDSTGYPYIWGNDVVLIHRPDTLTNDGQEIASSYTFRWTGAGTGQDGTASGGFFVRSYYDPKRGARGGTVVVVGHSDAEVLVTDVVGGLLVDAHQ
jgi:hypothetical protein